MKEAFEEFGAVSSLDALGALAALGRAKGSGTARFEGPAGEEIRYGFDGGFLVALETPEENSPAQVLIRSGKLQPATFESLSIGEGENRFAVAVASGVVSRREAAWGLKISAIESLVRVLSWAGGSYAFEDAPPSPTEPPIRLGIDPWILELFLRSSDRGFVLRRAGATDIPVSRASSFGPRFSALGLTADADAVVEAIDGTRSIEQIVKRSRADEFATLKLLAALTTLGLIHPELEAPLEIPAATAEPEMTPDLEESFPTPSAGGSVPGDAEILPEAPVESEAFPAESDASPAESPLPVEGEEPATDFPAWEPEPAPIESRIDPEPADPETSELHLAGERVPDDENAGIAMESASEPEIEPPPEVEREPPVPLRELPNLPLFALTAPEAGDPASPEDAGPSGSTEGEAALPPPPARRGWFWGAAAAGIAVLAGALFLRSRAPFVPPPSPSASPRTEEPPPLTPPAPAPKSLPPTTRPAVPPPISSLRTNSAADRRVPAEAPATADRRATPPARPAAGARAPGSALSPPPRRETSPAAGDDRRWRDMAEKGRRAFERPGRLRYAIQLELACEPGTLEKAFAQDAGSHAIWIAPSAFRGRPCYRVLFGRYADLAGAKAARSSVPTLFTREGNRPTVVSLGKAKPAPVKKGRSRK